MNPLSILLFVLIIMIGLLIMGSLFSNSIMTFLQRRLPNFSGQDDTVLLGSGLIMAAFILGLLVMYILLHT